MSTVDVNSISGAVNARASLAGSINAKSPIVGSVSDKNSVSGSANVGNTLKGEPGYTPIKGKDYFTEEETQAFINTVLLAIGDHPRYARIGEVTIFADQWVGEESPYSQVVIVEGATEYSQVDLTPSIAQLAIFYEKDIGFVTENDGGTVTVYAIGQKPTNDYTIQVTITEVDV